MTSGMLDSFAVLKPCDVLGRPIRYLNQAARDRSKEPQHNIRHCPSGDIQESITRDWVTHGPIIFLECKFSACALVGFAALIDSLEFIVLIAIDSVVNYYSLLVVIWDH